MLVKPRCSATLEHPVIAHEELGARHVRAVGMLDDELRVMTPDPVLWRREGDRLADAPNWQTATAVIERLLRTGVFTIPVTLPFFAIEFAR